MNHRNFQEITAADKDNCDDASIWFSLPVNLDRTCCKIHDTFDLDRFQTTFGGTYFEFARYNSNSCCVRCDLHAHMVLQGTIPFEGHHKFMPIDQSCTGFGSFDDHKLIANFHLNIQNLADTSYLDRC